MVCPDIPSESGKLYLSRFGSTRQAEHRKESRSTALPGRIAGLGRAGEAGPALARSAPAWLSPLPPDLLCEAVPGFEVNYFTRFKGSFLVVLVDFDHPQGGVPSAERDDLLSGDGFVVPGIFCPLDIHEKLLTSLCPSLCHRKVPFLLRFGLTPTSTILLDHTGKVLYMSSTFFSIKALDS